MKSQKLHFYQQADFQKNFALNIFALTLIVILLIIPNLMQGMAGDGLVYAGIANNMAHHIGSLWQPSFSQTTQAHFYDHPPLALYIESFFYRLFGDGFYVEKLYNLFTAAVNLYLVVKIWRLCAKPRTAWLVWLPILCWLLIPLNTYAYRSNLLENTLTCFTNLAVYLILLYRVATGARRHLLLGLAALSITFGFFCNGLQCFFPLITIAIYYFMFPNTLPPTSAITIRSIIKTTLILAALTLLMIGLILCYQPAHDNIIHYVNQQILATLGNHRTTPQSGIYRLTVIYFIIQNTLPLILIFFGFVIGVKYQDRSNQLFTNIRIKKWAIFFLILSFAASLPVMISPRQQDNYLIPAYPLFSLTFTFLFYGINLQCPKLSCLIQSRTVRLSSVIFLIISLFSAITLAGKYSRDKTLLDDINQINQKITPDKLVYIDQSLQGDSQIHGYFYRYHNVSLATTPTTPFLIIARQPQGESVPKNYQLVPIPLKHFLLYKKEAS